MADQRFISGSNYHEVHNSGQYAEGDIVNLSSEDQRTLAEATTEIRALLEQIGKTYVTDTLTGKMEAATAVIAQIEGNASLRKRLFSAGQAAAIAALEKSIEHPLLAPVVAALKDWNRTKLK